MSRRYRMLQAVKDRENDMLYIERCMEAMGFGQVIEPLAEVTGGLLHKMYSVSTTSDKYAVKILNGKIMKKPHAIQNTINSEKIASIISKSIPAVSSFIVDNEQIHKQNGCYFIIFPWMEGHSVYALEIGVKHCQIIGDVLGRIHKLNVHLNGMEMDRDDNALYDWGYILDVASKKASSDETWYSCIKNSMDDIVRWNMEAKDACAYLKLNRVISHRDLDPKNVLWADFQAYIIDWEAAGYINPYQELLEVIIIGQQTKMESSKRNILTQ